MCATTFSEIDSFALRFKSLLPSGIKATLTFESEEGTAHVTLKAGLGSNYVPTAKDMSLLCQNSNVFSLKKHRSPAYSRRQERRKLVQNQRSMSEEEFNNLDASCRSHSHSEAEEAQVRPILEAAENNAVNVKKCECGYTCS